MTAEAGVLMVACMPVEAAARFMPDFAGTAPDAQYEKVPCPGCAEEMWLGQRSKALVQAGTARALCMVCVVALTGPEALNEIALLSGAKLQDEHHYEDSDDSRD